jgi:serine/threonine-protein kinase RsbW
MLGTNSTSPGWQRHDLHTVDHMRQVLTALMTELRGHGYSEKEMFGIRLSLEEAIVNGMKHGNRGDSSRCVHFRYRLDGHSFLAEVEDEGPGFNPVALPDPLAPENIELPGGRGVFLMRHYMTAVRYNVAGNCVTLYKTRDASVPHPGANGTVEHS